MQKKRQLTTVVVFGSIATDAYIEEGFGKMVKVLERGTGMLVKHEFNTIDEVNAYLIGIEEMAGWEESSPLSDDDIMKHPRIINKLTK